MIAWVWDGGPALVAALAPLVAIPLGVITFYLRSLHEIQSNLHAELVRRFEGLERRVGDLAREVSGFARDYTTREEWLRECLHTRGRVERLTELAGGRCTACETMPKRQQCNAEAIAGGQDERTREHNGGKRRRADKRRRK